MASNSNAEELVATAVARSCAQAAPGIPLRSGLLGDLSRAISCASPSCAPSPLTGFSSWPCPTGRNW